MEAVGGHLGFAALIEETSGGSPPKHTCMCHTHSTGGDTVPACEEPSLEEPGTFLKTLSPHFNVPLIHLGFCDRAELGGARDAAFLTSLQVMLVSGLRRGEGGSTERLGEGGCECIVGSPG